jgi:hypothetical protein
MSEKAPGGNPSKDPEKLKIVKSAGQRLGAVTRREALSYTGAAVGSALGGYVLAEASTRKLFGTEAAAYKAEEAFIKEQLAKYEQARAKGTASWLDEWKRNFHKGIDKHGLDFFGAMKEFSEEGLRTRLFGLELLSGGYKMVNAGFFVLYTSMLFTPIKAGLGSYIEKRATRVKDKKVEDFANNLAQRVEALGQQLRALEDKVETGVSKDEFLAAIQGFEGIIKDLLVLNEPSPEASSGERDKNLPRE